MRGQPELAKVLLQDRTKNQYLFKEGITSMTEVTPATLEERVVRLRADLLSTPQGQKKIMELSPAGMVKTDPDIVNFTSWQQWSQWSQSQ